MLSAASKSFDWGVPMPEVAKVWRAGCIIRSDMLNDMAAALGGRPRAQPDPRARASLATSNAPMARCAVSSPPARSPACPCLRSLRA